MKPVTQEEFQQYRLICLSSAREDPSGPKVVDRRDPDVVGATRVDVSDPNAGQVLAPGEIFVK